MHEFLEDAAAMFVILKLVEAGAGGGEQNDVAGVRRAGGKLDSAIERAGAFNGDAAGKLAFDFVGSGADEERENRLFAERLLKRGVIAAFVLAAKDDESA